MYVCNTVVHWVSCIYYMSAAGGGGVLVDLALALRGPRALRGEPILRSRLQGGSFSLLLGDVQTLNTMVIELNENSTCFNLKQSTPLQFSHNCHCAID
ncbi:hypothetical protein EVAR_6022_1 [Eumeta japonica]|uniref:Uncharacterized protein n=1 Tax=Eumeta variegata TaxID=151549 RepID=A0A4C1TCR5_EUMVA|nr:hypothetical protein EVAR_6022_1 [Eumeta japonica]